MDNHSLESLVAWMKLPTSDVMLGWDVIAALARGKANRLLIQEYIARFNSGTYLPAISGSKSITQDVTQLYFKDFILDVPRLSFEVQVASGIESVKAVLNMAVLGGTQIVMEKNVDFWRASTLSFIDPLEGPRLFLDLQLANVPGIVDQDGRILLDLSLSDNFRLEFANSSTTEQRLTGEFFQKLFNELDPEQRVYPLGVINRGDTTLMQPETFALRAQSNGLSGADGFGDGAILVLIQMLGSLPGNFPGASYKYLIPNDPGKDYSATVLFGDDISKSLQVMESLVLVMTELLGSPEFVFTYSQDQNPRLISATSTSGGVSIEASRVRLGPHLYQGKQYYFFLINSGVDLPAVASSPLTVIRNMDDTFSVKWTSEADAKIAVIVEGSSLDPATVDTRVKLSLDAQYAMIQSAGGGLAVEPVYFNLSIHQETVDSKQVVAQSDAKALDPLILFLIGLVELYFMDNLINLKPEVRAKLEASIKISRSVSDFIEKNIELNFGQAITDTTILAPRNVVAVGHINPVTTAFTVSPLEPLILAGATQQFTTEPSIAGVTWSVEELLRTSVQKTGQTGSITAAGLYTAPAATLIPGSFVRVRVTATRTNGQHSSALVTIVALGLTANPQIQICNPGSTVDVSVGNLGGTALTWSIVSGSAQSGTLTPQASGCSYTAKPSLGEEDRFVTDVIKVSAVDGTSYSVLVLVPYAEALKIKSLDIPLPSSGTVQLEAWAKKKVAATWKLPMGGPGEIDAVTGFYTADPVAKEQFVLVLAEYDSDVGLLEGYVILPLPLNVFIPDEAS